MSGWITLFTCPNKQWHFAKKCLCTAVCGLKGVFHNKFKCQTGFNLLYKFSLPSTSGSMCNSVSWTAGERMNKHSFKRKEKDYYKLTVNLVGCDIYSLSSFFPADKGRVESKILDSTVSVLRESLYFLLVCKNIFQGSHKSSECFKIYWFGSCFFDFIYFWSYSILAKQNTDLFSPDYVFGKQVVSPFSVLLCLNFCILFYSIPSLLKSKMEKKI